MVLFLFTYIKYYNVALQPKNRILFSFALRILYLIILDCAYVLLITFTTILAHFFLE